MFGQSVKVTNDALVQSKIDDYFRGRVFSVYDVVVNSAIVTGALFAAWILPISGDSWLLPLVVSISWVLVATVLLRPEKFLLKDDA
jgi:MFS family permease